MKAVAISFLFLVFCIPGIGQTGNLVPCRKGDYWSFCDSTGKVIVDGKWITVVEQFKHGYARAHTETRWGYIDSTEKWESDCPFEDVGKFHYGYAWAHNNRNR